MERNVISHLKKAGTSVRVSHDGRNGQDAHDGTVQRHHVSHSYYSSSSNHHPAYGYTAKKFHSPNFSLVSERDSDTQSAGNSSRKTSYSNFDNGCKRDGMQNDDNSGKLVPLVLGPRTERRCNSSAELQEIELRNKDYNRQDFETKHTSAKFYVIKSFSEDDIHKSIKYRVWSSTRMGNEKLHLAYQNADREKCPIFLFFSVNTSGQFVGMAEMIGEVDFEKNMEFWQSDMWKGFFPVKWVIVKDIPHSSLFHIVPDNNEGKPVTFTRDTHEIGLKHGLEMLRIFKNYSAETSLLDDFSFYNDRENLLLKSKNGNLKTVISPKLDDNGRTNPSDPLWLVMIKENLALNGYHIKNSSNAS